MPRPRTQSDEEIFEGLQRAMCVAGPDKLSLAVVAREVGLSPATLIQRFGSKRGMLLAFVRQYYDRLDRDFDAARRSSPSALAAVVRFFSELAGGVHTPEEMANLVAYLHVDLADPEFHAPLQRWSEAILAKLEALLGEAIREGELVPCDTVLIARSIWVTYNGSLVSWAIHREGQLVDWIGDNLEALLEPHRWR